VCIVRVASGAGRLHDDCAKDDDVDVPVVVVIVVVVVVTNFPRGVIEEDSRG
jgi:hypothetical protein